MTRIYMVRHGRAAAGFGESMDPGLDELGQSQAKDVSVRLQPLGPMDIVSSPLARARQTAAPLASLWKRTPAIEPAIAEIPSPTENLQERVVWLRTFMAGSWREATPVLATWRESAIAALIERREDTVVFSHYVAINVATGAALSDDRVVVFSPDNCSVTIFEIDGGTLRLIEKGHEAPLTKVN
ncbi:MAG: histidine phosphatase family protein [Rhizomicrobium sp.]|jgi:broad specificity phosphatase PhoE